MNHNKIINLIPSTISVANIILSAMMALCLYSKYDTEFAWYMINVPAFYMLCHLSYFGCNKLAERLVLPFSNALGKYVLRKQKEAVEEALSNYKPSVIETDKDAKGIQYQSEETINVLEYDKTLTQVQSENIIIKEQIKRDEFEKLEKVLAYTRNTFFHLGFEDGEVTQIVECVRYFVCSKTVLCHDILCIKRKSNVTQASLKNFAWNVAAQYSIDNQTTARFVKHTFKEWFNETELSSIVKTLRNTTGHHAVEIDPNILKERA